ncbi:MAG: DNA adenine methylase [Ignavibacteriaceae bacterium]
MIPYIGGKSYLANWIISNFPQNYRELTYCEVFGGGGWVLFKKDESYVEVYNDLNKNLVNMFKIIRDNFKEFEYKCQWSLHSREMYNEAREKFKDDKFISDLERAMHYAIERVQSFSGHSSGSWGYAITADKIISGKWLPFLKRLVYINARLKRVQVECLDFEKVIKKYDTTKTLFYLDPPYVGCENYYKTNDVHFKLEDHYRLAAILKKIKGKYVLSYYDDPLVLKLYKGNKILKKEAVKHSCGVVRTRKIKEKPKSTELLIMNY